MSYSNNIYNNIYPFYESARQARIERKERNKDKKQDNIRKRNKVREDCLERATVTEGSELKSLLTKDKLRKKFRFYIKNIGFRYWGYKKD